MASTHAAYRRSMVKGGPRVVTYIPPSVGGVIQAAVLTNCKKCTPLPGNAEVRGEGGTVASVALLRHSWYIIQADVDIFWQQLRPKDACAADPQQFGRKLEAGESAEFFVTRSSQDGVIAVSFCPGQQMPALCDQAKPTRPEGVVRIIRDDTLFSMAATKDNATKMDVEASKPNTCE